VAEVLDSTVAAVNSALERARATVEQLLPVTTREASDETERRLLERYIEAFETDDVDGLVALLREDATLTMPPEPAVIGARAIARFFDATPVGTSHVCASGRLGRTGGPPWRSTGRPTTAG
jgi:RNA polymerase sigma-70 factor, ECF subfamily